MQVTLTPEIEALIEQQMKSGRFEDPTELIATALHALADDHPFEPSQLESMIEEGARDVEDGNVFTKDEAKAYLRAMRAKL